MIDKFSALQKLNSQVVTLRGDVAYDANDNVVEYDKAAVEAYVQANEYKAKRAAEYPPITDFVDAYYWMQKGKPELMDAYVAKCEATKLKYPK